LSGEETLRRACNIFISWYFSIDHSIRKKNYITDRFIVSFTYCFMGKFLLGGILLNDPTGNTISSYSTRYFLIYASTPLSAGITSFDTIGRTTLGFFRPSRNRKTCLIYRNCRHYLKAPTKLRNEIWFPARERQLASSNAERNGVFFSRGKFRDCSTIPALYLMTLVISRRFSPPAPATGDYTTYLNCAQVNFTRDNTRCITLHRRRSLPPRVFFLAPEFRDITILSSRAREPILHMRAPSSSENTSFNLNRYNPLIRRGAC
jgi:hypothetical protein